MLRSFFFATLLLAAAALPARAQPAGGVPLDAAALFSDGAVLQRGQPVPVWGTAAPGAAVAVTLGEHVAWARTAGDSTWRATLGPLRAGGPHRLTVETRAPGDGNDAASGQQLVFDDVLVGEVWLAGGQSNMEWYVQDAQDARQALARVSDDRLRLFDVAHDMAARPRRALAAGAPAWRTADSASVAPFSAVAYYFGRRLREALDVPVGLVSSNWGGTPAEAWTSTASLRALPDFRQEARALENGPARMEAVMQRRQGDYPERLAAWQRAVRARDAGYAGSGDGATLPRWADPVFDASGWDTARQPQTWEDGPLPGFDGVVWMRRAFDLPASMTGRPLTLLLPPIDDADTTWVNGVQVGSGDSWNTPRTYEVPASALRAGRNVVAVRATDFGRAGGFYGEAEQLALTTASSAGGPPERLSLAGDWRVRVGTGFDETGPPPQRPPPQHVPSVLYNAMIAPLVPYALRGVVWYQGESNAGSAERARQYRTLFPALIRDWRARFGQPQMPFYFVQLANFLERQTRPVERDPWPLLREAQRGALRLPATGMAVTTDVGAADDIHPRDKETVGRRLARIALAQTYGRGDVAYHGPAFRRMETGGLGEKLGDGAARLVFDPGTAGGLTARGGSLDGFAVRAAGGDFRWAEARVESDSTVVVRHPDGQPVAAVRYNWANNPVGTLFNAAGLPASPFRTDAPAGVALARE